MVMEIDLGDAELQKNILNLETVLVSSTWVLYPIHLTDFMW